MVTGIPPPTGIVPTLPLVLPVGSPGETCENEGGFAGAIAGGGELAPLPTGGKPLEPLPIGMMLNPGKPGAPGNPTVGAG